MWKLIAMIIRLVGDDPNRHGCFCTERTLNLYSVKQSIWCWCGDTVMSIVKTVKKCSFFSTKRISHCEASISSPTLRLTADDVDIDVTAAANEISNRTTQSHTVQCTANVHGDSNNSVSPISHLSKIGHIRSVSQELTSDLDQH